MLTNDLIQARVVKGKVRPRFIEPDSTAHRALARQLVDTFERHVGRSRGELKAELAELLGTGTAFLLHRGLAKLLLDRCELTVEAPVEPAELRAAVFAQAARAYRRQAAQPTEADSAQVFRFDRGAVLAEAARGLGLTPDEAEAGLYADLREEQILSQFETCSPEWLLRRYNVALAQGVLFRATEMELRIAGQTARRYRALFRKIKFFRLLHRVEGSCRRGFTIRLDGPFSLFQSSQRYGLQMASFLPTLLHFDQWSLEAQVRWGPKRIARTFALSAKDGLSPFGHLTGQWLPDELAAFPAAFDRLESPWTVNTEGSLLELGGQGVLIPDFSFRHEDGTEIHLEVLGYWRKNEVESRLTLLADNGPGNLILALGKSLAAGRESIDELPDAVYVYRSSPLPRRVLERLEALRTQRAEPGAS